jgi:hypothetical protein
MLQPLVQKYPAAYYCHVGANEHYVMFEGIRTRHGTMDEALQVCEGINERKGLPHINVHKSSTFNQRKSHVS